MIIAILILVLSVLFITRLLNLKFFNFLHAKKPLNSSHEASLQPAVSCLESNRKASYMKMIKEEEDDLKRFFDAFDKDGDGFITKKELKKSLSNIGINVQVKDVEEMVEKLDANKDGLVDLREFRELYELVVKGKKENKFEVNKKVGDFDDEDEEVLKEAFKVFDENNDGKITVQELGIVLSSLGLKEGKGEEDCKEMIKKVDVDGDGMVNFNEFKKMMKTRSGTSSRLVVT